MRVVLRATRGYHLLAAAGHHPDLLRDGLDRDRHLDRLWLGVGERPWLERTVPFERRDLAVGDMPYFTARPGARDLWTSGGERLRGLVAEPPLAAVRRNLGRLAAPREAMLQDWLVDTAFLSQAYHRDDLPWPRFTPPPPRPEPADLDARLLAAATDVGHRLADLALEDGGEATWAGLERDGRAWTLAPLGEDLYGGTPGIVLALAWLGAATGEARFRELAERAFATLEGRLRRTADALRFVGAFQGWGGLVYLYDHLAIVWRRPDLLDRAEDAMTRIEALLDEDVDLDVVAGRAGAILVLLGLAEAGGPPRALRLARSFGESLLARAEPAAGGLGWTTRLSAVGEAPQTGLSHGTSGIGWALARLAAATGDARFADAATAAYRYERSRYSPRDGNWLDAGDSTADGARPREGGAKATSMAWCYGAPGIGLARLDSLAVTDDPAVREDLARALATTRRRGFGFNHSLCHGDLGNLDLLQQAAAALGDEELAGEVRRRAAATLDSLAAHGPLCGTPLAAQAPGLMSGLAGIALGLARLALPRRIPSVLALAPPPAPTRELSRSSGDTDTSEIAEGVSEQPST